MNISDRIKQRMKTLGLKGVDITKTTGVSSGGVSQWVNGATKPNGEKLISLCKALKCQPDWLLYGKDEPSKPQQNAEWIGEIEPWDNRTPLGEDEVELPVLTEVELSAGNGVNAVQENHGSKLRFAKSTLKRNGINPEHAACVKVCGTSMAPVLPDGATVGIDTANTSIKDGEMYAIDQDGMLRIKLIYRLPSGAIRLRSFNSEEYPDERYEGEYVKNIRIIGRVFWYSVLR
ncbi:S24 family peptidase [Candidatus Williamhamiltonella defendens]|uniref:XRE family transcriptional regulator n=1 Tax=Candidatus Hamiltonella defensa (Bemisia tabaci) TaxID=672795 RepID=A0A249DYA3_9ENTR|nr:S24 family peptidase [Candidatus Hamiltonella defensa]ASX25887.1 XRE family transcriptional regulator [Candidatus Hamiltonella defensa (Bemisia tabaci)]CED78264.1 Putative phage repressor [Candidatus Hamiltonella defensa (Bemisia tabaci)]